MVNSNKQDLSSIETHPIVLPQGDVYYEVPLVKELGKPFENVSRAYLEQRLNYMIGRLVQRVTVATAKHLSDKKETTLRNIEKLRESIQSAIEDVASRGIDHKSQLKAFCRKVTRAIDVYKGDTENTLHRSQRLLQMFIEKEREIINDSVNLKNGTVTVDIAQMTEEERDIYKLNTSIDELIAMGGSLRKMLDDLDMGEGADSFIVGSVLEDMENIVNLIDKFPTNEDVMKMPQTVQVVVFDVFREVIMFFERVGVLLVKASAAKDFSENLMEHSTTCDQGMAYFRGLVGFKHREDLQERVNALCERKKELNKVDNLVLTIHDRAKSVAMAAGELQEREDIRGLLRRVIEISSPENNSEFISQFIGEDVDDEAEKEEEVGSQERIPLSDGGYRLGKFEETDEVFEKKRFSWKKESEEAVKEEAKRRLFQNTLLRDLYGAERWQDFHLVFHMLSTKELVAMKLYGTCFGSANAFLQDRKEFIALCFPEILEIGVPRSFPSTLQRGKASKRFRWSLELHSVAEIHQEIKRRLFGTWPLLQELFELNRLEELNYLFGKMSAHILQSEFRITSACIGGENAPYASVDTMFIDVFPEVYSS